MEDLPPSYDEAVGIPLSELSVRELMRIPNVSRVHLHDQQNVLAKTSLLIYQFSRECGGQSFLKIDDWVHPLIPGQTAFSLDLTGLLGLSTQLDTPGVFVSLWVEGISPAYAYPLARLLLDVGLHVEEKLDAHVQSVQPTISAEDKIKIWEILGFRSGFEALARFVVWSAYLAQSYLAFRVGTVGTSGAAPPTSTELVRSSFGKGLHAVRVAGDAAALVTSSVVAAVGEASKCVTRTVAPRIERGGIKLIELTTGKRPEEAQVVLETVKGTASLAVEGFERVYISVSDAITWLGRSAKCTSAAFLAKRFGPDAGVAADEALGVLGSAAVTTYNVGFLTTRGLAHIAAVNSARAWVQSGNHRSLTSSATVLPDLTPSAPPMEDDEDCESFEFLDLDEKPPCMEVLEGVRANFV